MKNYLLVSIKMTIVMLTLCCMIYFLIIGGIGKLSPGGGDGVKLMVNGKVVGYERIGQKFSDDKYFWGRPSAVDYNAAGSGGSNKAASNPDYIQLVKNRIDSFVVHNPGIDKSQIPAEMVTASGSGLDPHISPESALIQVDRIARSRNLEVVKIKQLIDQNTETNAFGPNVINVLKINIALDALK